MKTERKPVLEKRKTRKLHLVRKPELEFDIPATPFVIPSYPVPLSHFTVVAQSTITRINRRIRTKISTAMQELDIVSSTPSPSAFRFNTKTIASNFTFKPHQ